MARDDAYHGDDLYRDDLRRDDLRRPEDGSRPARRATRPTRPAWDALTYGRPDDARRPIRPVGPEGPSYGSRPAEPDRDRTQPASDWPRTGRTTPPSVFRSPPTPSYPAAEPTFSEPTFSEPTFSEPTFSEPTFSEPPFPEPTFPEPTFREPTFRESRSAESAYPAAAPAYPPPPAYPAGSTSPAASLYPGGAPSYPAAEPTYPGGQPTSSSAADRAYPAGEPPYSAAERAYPAGEPPYSASSYAAEPYAPPAVPDSFAPDSYTTYRAPSTSTSASAAVDEEPVYVAAGLYLDEQAAEPAESRPAEGRSTEWATPGDASAYPGGLPDEPAAGKGGRNVPVAIGVGLGLGAVVLATLFLWRPAFLGVIAVAVGVGIWELVRALRLIGANPPMVPLIAGGVLMTGLAWWGGTEGLTFGLVVTVVAVMVWRFAYGVTGYATDVTMAGLVAVYIPFLGGFAAMLTSPPDGHLRLLAVLIAVVLSDTGGYVVGSRFGKHPMAPSVSPKKSWEGLAGSLGAAALGSAIVVWLMFDVAPWWGLLFGLAISAASVVGDLAESMVKRAIGVKDMSGLLPGHGGVMDRIDSVLFAAPVGYVLLSAMVPVG